MDSLLLIGNSDQKLADFLSRMGYSVQFAQQPEIPQILSNSLFDLIFIDGRNVSAPAELCSFLRTQESTRGVPVLCACESPTQRIDISGRRLDKVELVEAPFAIGSVVGKIATLLRLRKTAGKDDLHASLGEMNASLRDLNAKFSRQLEEAREIQEGLLPDALPSDSRYEIAVAYQPLEEVGGDWYYVRNIEGGALSIQIADVTGHGLSAAFIGSMTKLALYAADRKLPHELLERLNSLMAPQLPQGRFVTMASFLYDPASGHLDFARAGHPQGLIMQRKTGKVLSLNVDGFPVGFMDDATYAGGTVEVATNDLLVTYTDGISEAQNPAGQTYGVTRLEAVLIGSAPTDSAPSVIQKILDDLDRFCEGRIIKDDITVLVLKRLN